MKKQKNRLGRKPGNGSSSKIVQGGFRKIAGNLRRIPCNPFPAAGNEAQTK